MNCQTGCSDACSDGLFLHRATSFFEFSVGSLAIKKKHSLSKEVYISQIMLDKK